MVNVDPRKESPATKDEDSEAPEWRGGNRPEQEERQRSEERGWGAADAGGKATEDKATEEE